MQRLQRTAKVKPTNNGATRTRRKRVASVVDLVPLSLLLAPVVGILARGLKIGAAGATLVGAIDTRFVNYILEWGYLHLRGAAAPNESLWSPPFFYPVKHVLAYSENMFSAYLFYFPLRWLGLRPSEALFTFRLLQLAITPVVAYFCLRAFRLGRWSAFVGAAVFSWGWIRYFHYGHIQFSAGYPIPLFVTALYFAFHRRQPWALVVTAWTFLFTWYLSLYTAVFLILCTVVLATVWLLLPGGPHEVRTTFRFYGHYARRHRFQAITILLLCLCVVALIAPSALVYREVQQGRLRADSEAQLRLYWGDIFSWVRPPQGHWLLGSFHTRFPKQTGGIWEMNAFLGWLGVSALLLPLTGLLVKRRRIYLIWPRSLIAASGAGAAIMLGCSSYGGSWPELPFLFLHRHLPGLSGMRAPTRIAFVVSWLSVVCVAAILDSLLRRCAVSRWIAVGLGLCLLGENVAPLPWVVDRRIDEAVWRDTARHLCQNVPRDQIGTLVFLPMDTHSLKRIVENGLAMQLSQKCNFNVVNGYSARSPRLIEPLLTTPPDIFPCKDFLRIVDRIHRISGKAILIHLDAGPPLGPAGYPTSAIRNCLRSCLGPEPTWYTPSQERPATVFVTDPRASCVGEEQ